MIVLMWIPGSEYSVNQVAFTTNMAHGDCCPGFIFYTSAHCNIGIWEIWVLRGTGPIFASGNSLVSIWSFLLGLLLRIAVHGYDLSRWNLYFGQNDFIVSITLGVLIHQLSFRVYYWPRNTHLDNLDSLPWEMETQNFWKKSLGTNFFYFSNWPALVSSIP